MTEIEQLKADIATLEAADGVFSRKYGQTYQRYNIELDKMRKQLVRLEVQADVLAISGIGELNQYLMDKGVGIVGDMTARIALDRIKSLEAELAKRAVVWCVLREGGYMRRRCGCVKTFTDRDKRSSSITETAFRPYTGEPQ